MANQFFNRQGALMKRWKQAALSALAVMILGGMGHANEKKSEQQREQQHRAMLEQLDQGEAYSSGAETYIFLPKVKAFLPSAGTDHESSRKSLRQAGVPDADVLEQKGDFVITKVSDALASARTLSTASLNKYSVMLNPRTEQFGIVLGDLIVKLHSMNDAPALSESGLRLVRRFDHLQTAIYQASSTELLFATFRKLQSDPRVAKVQLDVLEQVKVPQ